MASVNALIAIREQNLAERRQQEAPHCDSGMGTSVGDSESEAESLGDHVRPGFNEQARQDSDGASSDENNDREVNYNYAQEEEEEEEEEESSESEGEDDFMKDRQTTEDYSAYRERIFDFAPKGYEENKLLVEELNNEGAPSTSGVNMAAKANEETERDRNASDFQHMAEFIGQAIAINPYNSREKEETGKNVGTLLKDNIEDTSSIDKIEDNARTIRKDREVRILIEEMDNDEDDNVQDLTEENKEQNKADIKDILSKTDSKEISNEQNEAENYASEQQLEITEEDHDTRERSNDNTDTNTKEASEITEEDDEEVINENIIEETVESTEENMGDIKKKSEIIEAEENNTNKGSYEEISNEIVQENSELLEETVEMKVETSELSETEENIINKESYKIADEIVQENSERLEETEEEVKSELPETEENRLTTEGNEVVEENAEEPEDLKAESCVGLGNEEDSVDNAENMSDKKRSDLRLIQDTINRIKKSDPSLSAWTFDDYLDKVEQEAASKNLDEEAAKEEEEQATEMTKNIGGESLNNEGSIQGSTTEPVTQPLTSKTLRQIMRRNIIKVSTDSDEDDDDVASDKEMEVSQTLIPTGFAPVSENGDGPVKCNLTTVGNEDVNQSMVEDSKQSGMSSTGQAEKPGLVAETIEDIEQVLSDSLKINEQVLKARRSRGKGACLKPGAMKETIKNLLTGWKQMSENPETSSEESSDGEESDASTIDEKRPYYRKLDKSDSTNLTTTTEIDEEACEATEPVKSKEDIKKELQTEPQEADVEDKDTRYREMLDWDMQVSQRTIQILGPRRRENTCRSELCDMIAQTTKKDKPEFEITPPKNIAEEDDVIMYARRRKRNIICNQNSSMYKEPGRLWDEIPPHVQKALKMSQSYPVFQKHQNDLIQTETKTNSTPNSLTVSNKISEVRVQMAEFTKRLDDFKERSRLAREEVIKDYNDAVEKELQIVDEIMKKRETSLEVLKARWNVKSKERKPCHIDESMLRKHFEEMGIIVEEQEYREEYLRPVQRFDEMELQTQGFDKAENVDLEAERKELLENISCEENMICSESTNRASFEEAAPVQEEHNEVSADELMDIDPYEECPAINGDEEKEDTVPNQDELMCVGTNRDEEEEKTITDKEFNQMVHTEIYEECHVDEEEERTIRNNEFDLNYYELASYLPEPISDYAEENILEMSGESYEEYFTTNEEDSEEYDERTDVKYEELENIEIGEGFNFDQCMGCVSKTEEQQTTEEKEERSEENSFEDCRDKVVDDTGTVERPVIKRNLTCSLEMQLAKKTD